MLKKTTASFFLILLIPLLCVACNSQPQPTAKETISYELYGAYEIDLAAFQEDDELSPDIQTSWFCWLPDFRKIQNLIDKYVKDFPVDELAAQLYPDNPKRIYTDPEQPVMFTVGRKLERLGYYYDEIYKEPRSHDIRNLGIDDIIFSEVTFSEEYQDNTMYFYIRTSEAVMLQPAMFPLRGPTDHDYAADGIKGHTYYIMKNGKAVYWGNDLRTLNGYAPYSETVDSEN